MRQIGRLIALICVYVCEYVYICGYMCVNVYVSDMFQLDMGRPGYNVRNVLMY